MLRQTDTLFANVVEFADRNRVIHEALHLAIQRNRRDIRAACARLLDRQAEPSDWNDVKSFLHPQRVSA